VECDGEYVDHGNNAEECLDALQAWAASINVSASGSATASCNNGQCTASAEGEASCECASAPGGSPLFSTTSALLGASALGIGAVLRRRRRAQNQR
jgi:MYXO-CTERM domain-containing protein